MTTKLQPPVGTVIETGEEAIRILLSPEYVEFFASADCKQLTNLRGHVVYFNEVVEGRYLPYTVIGVSEGFTEDPNFSMQERVEQVTIPAGEMSWEEWQGHLDAMSARDGVTLVYNPGEYVHYSGIQVSIADLFVPHPFPLTFHKPFTYSPVYPQLTDSRKLGKPPLYKGRVFHTWEELEDVVEAYGLTDENSECCFEDADGFEKSDPITQIEERDTYFPLPWTLIKMPDVEDAPSEPPPEPLKHYVWVDGKPFPSKAHDARQEAVKEALRLSQKENKYAVVCTDIIKPVTRAEIVEL